MLTRRQNASGSRRQGRVRLGAALVALGPMALTPFAVTAAAPAIQLPVDEVRLDNGMTLLLLERPGAPYVAAGWVVGSGSADDPMDRRGLAHVLEHMMFQGSEVIGTRDFAAERAAEREVRELRLELEKLAKRGRERGRRTVELERRVAELDDRRRRLLRPGELALRYSEAGAGGLNAYTFEDFTLYFVRLPPGKLELWFWLESDRLLHPVFRNFDKEREVIRQEVGQRIDSMPTGRADDALRRAFWGESSYSWRPLGWVDDLARVQPRDAERFFARHYVPDRVTAVVVGSFDRQRAGALARSYFGRLRPFPVSSAAPARPATAAGATDSLERRATPAAPPGDEPFETRCDCPRQARVLYPTVPFRHPDSYRLQVLAGVLNGRTGRLYRSLVLDHEIAFSASATQLSYRDAGSFVFAAETKGDATPEDLVAAWDDELERLGREPVGDGELRKVKNQLIASSLRGLRRPTDLARQLLLYAGLGEWRQIEQWPRRVDEVTAQELQRVARRLTPENRLIAYYRRRADAVGVPRP